MRHQGRRQKAEGRNSLTLNLAFCSAIAALLCASSGCTRPIVAGPKPDVDAAMQIREALMANAAPAEGEAAQGQAGAESAGWATLKGRFVYEGTAPAPRALNIDKDVAVCSKHRLVDESLVVASDGGLANVVVYVRTRNVKVHPDYEATANQPQVLDNHDCHFQPHVLAVRTGQPLVLKNSDPVGHNTNAALASNTPFNVIVPANAEATQTLSSAEPLPATVTCNIHPWMKAYLVVQSHPYVAVSAKDGSFEIKNVPAGIPLELQVWHEASAGSNGAVQANRPDLKWQANGRFNVTLQPDEVFDLSEIKLPAEALAAR